MSWTGRVPCVFTVDVSCAPIDGKARTAVLFSRSLVTSNESVKNEQLVRKKNQEKQTKKKSLKTLRNFNQKLIISDWWDYRTLSLVLKRVNLKTVRRYGIKLLKMASDVIEHKDDED